MIPVKTGNIILPEIWIDGKKGIWVNSLITNVQTAQWRVLNQSNQSKWFHNIIINESFEFCITIS